MGLLKIGVNVGYHVHISDFTHHDMNEDTIMSLLEGKASCIYNRYIHV